MMRDESELTDDDFAALLLACEEARAAGADPFAYLEAKAIGDEQRHRLRDNLECLELLSSTLGSDRAPTTRRDPTAFGRFVLERRLGRGAFGVVWLAHDPSLERDVALKVPNADVLASQELRARFLHEARVAAALDHPNLVPVFEVGEAGPVCYIACAYCRGPNLAEWLRCQSEPVPIRSAVGLLVELASAVAHAHQRGVIHRDLKPSNVLLDGGDRLERSDGGPSAVSPFEPMGLPFVPRITDFGLAKVLSEDSAALTQSGSIVGTPQYMAPEQTGRDAGKVGPASDLHALGVILYECLTGRPPFRGDSTLETLEQVRSREPVPPRRLRTTVPRDLETVCLKCLDKDPRRRYAHASLLEDDLRRFLRGQPVLARPIPPHQRLARWAARRPMVLVLLGVLCLSVLALVLGSFWYLGKLREHNALLERQRSQERRVRTAAMDVLNKLVFDVQRDLRNAPGMERVEQKVLRTALEGLERVLGESAGTDRGLERDHATTVARNRLGRVYLTLGQNSEAEKEFGQACRIADDRSRSDAQGLLDSAESYLGLATARQRLGNSADAARLLAKVIQFATECMAIDPERQEPRECLMNARNELGDVYREQAALVHARMEYQATIDLGSALREGPDSATARREIAYALMNLGVISQLEGDLPRALLEFRRSIDLRRVLLRDTDGSYWARMDLAINLRTLGRSEMFEGELVPAQAHLLEVKTMFETLSAVNPRWQRVQRFSSNVHILLGRLSYMEGDLRTARSRLEMASRILQEQFEFSPSPLLRLELANCFQELAWFEAGALNPEAVADWVDRASQILEPLAGPGGDGNEVSPSTMLRELRRDRERAMAILNAKAHWNAEALLKDSGPAELAIRAEAAACLGDHARAARLCREIESMNDVEAGMLYRVGVVFVQCRTAIGHRSRDVNGARQEQGLRDHYASLAVEALDKAYRRGLGDRDRILRDITIDPLRLYPSFRSLIRRVSGQNAS